MKSIAELYDQINENFFDHSSKSPVVACQARPIVGKKWKAAAAEIFPKQQSYQNCGLQSSRQIIEQAKMTCLEKSELEFMEDAIKSCGAERAEIHPDNSGGSNARARRCVLKQYGVGSTVEDATVENVKSALQARQGVIMSADVEVLWQGRGVPPQSGRHAVVITHGEYGKDGQMTGVHVNDTGINKRYLLSMSELKDCLASGSGQLNVTSASIWPAD